MRFPDTFWWPTEVLILNWAFTKRQDKENALRSQGSTSPRVKWHLTFHSEFDLLRDEAKLLISYQQKVKNENKLEWWCLWHFLKNRSHIGSPGIKHTILSHPFLERSETDDLKEFRKSLLNTIVMLVEWFLYPCKNVMSLHIHKYEVHSQNN